MEERKKGGVLKRLLFGLVALAVLAYGGWFAYAKATGQEC